MGDLTAAAALGHGEKDAGVARRDRRKKKRKRSREAPWRGLYAPAAGSPDALYVAPDAGLSVRCFRSHQVSTGRTTPDAAGTLFLRPVHAIWYTHRTGRSEAASGASSGAPLSTFPTKHHVRL